MEQVSAREINVTEVDSEQLLIERARTDEAAFEQLYHTYVDKIFGYIYKRSGHREVAEDLTSTVFMKVFTNLSSYSYKDCSFSAWLYKIATNCLIDHYRSKGRRPEVMPEEMPEIHDSAQDVDTQLLLKEERERVVKVIAMLPERYQKILQLKFFAELANHEIAETLGISANNVGVLVHRALQKFEEKYTLV